MLRVLIWKDLRVNRFPLLLAGLLLLLSPVVIVTLTQIDSILIEQSWPRQLFAILSGCSIAIHLSAQLSIAILSANVVAIERVDRSAEFLAYLPPDRAMVMRAKGVVLAGAALTLFTIQLACAAAASIFGEPPDPAPVSSYFRFLLSTSSIGICAAGIGWMASCSVSSNAIAILVALASPLLVGAVVLVVCLAIGIDNTTHAGALLAAAFMAIGFIGFLMGTRHYLQRNEP